MGRARSNKKKEWGQTDPSCLVLVLESGFLCRLFSFSGFEKTFEIKRKARMIWKGNEIHPHWLYGKALPATGEKIFILIKGYHSITENGENLWD